MSKRSLSQLDLEAMAMQSNYKLHRMAKSIMLSTRQLERRFALEFGITPRVWLGNLRFRKAQDLLNRGESLKSVAGQLGYADRSVFSRAFKRQTGQTPTSFQMRISPDASSRTDVLSLWTRCVQHQATQQ